MDCPACRETGRSEPLVFEHGQIESIPGDMEHIPPPSKYPTNAECSFDSEHFCIVEVDEDEDRLSLILEAQVPGEDDVYEFTLSDLEIELT